MGKVEDEQPLPGSIVDEAQRRTDEQNNVGNSDRRECCFCCWNSSGRLKRAVSFRCVFALVLGIGVLFSAFFLLPFFHYGDQKDLDLDSEFGGHAIVASFMVDKPASFLEDYVLQLEDDIFEEISFSTTKVEVLKLEPSAGPNTTKVVFAVDSDVTTRSLIRASFVSILIHQSPLGLTASLFGNPYSFEVLKFLGGITVSPQQSAFLMQKVQILFNFTLNFSIEQLQNNFDELRRQLKLGLHLAPYENLYISLTNLRGSTVAPPTIVQCRVLLAVGINPSKSRFKQLTQTITGSHEENLGLNNTVFGRVKQVRLSSVPPPGGAGSPSPSPVPQPHHHHHHHHHHHRHPDTNYSPTVAPAPRSENSGSINSKDAPRSAPLAAPTPTQGLHHKVEPPGCHFGYKNGHPRNGNRQTPVSPPILAPVHAPSPQRQIDPPTPTVPQVPSSSPLPNVVFAHARPPSGREFDAEPPDIRPSVSPSPSSSSASITLCNLWAVLLFLLLVLYV